MTRSGRYCKAFLLRDMRRWDHWPQLVENDLGEESIVYLHDDYSVTRGILAGKDVIYAGVTPPWKSFCQEKLDFRVPELTLEESTCEDPAPSSISHQSSDSTP